MTFADKLRSLPSIDHLAAVQLLNTEGQVVAIIPNQPGKAGSARIYHALQVKHGCIHTAAAQEGLELFAEHTATARVHPGSHPNIDRLLEIIATGAIYQVQPISA